MKNLDLQEIRKKLDGIDARLVELFQERMRLCCDVAEYKLETGKAVYDGKREKEKLEAEGHTIIKKGRTNIKYFVKDYESVLFDLR